MRPKDVLILLTFASTALTSCESGVVKSTPTPESGCVPPAVATQVMENVATTVYELKATNPALLPTFEAAMTQKPIEPVCGSQAHKETQTAGPGATDTAEARLNEILSNGLTATANALTQTLPSLTPHP